MISTLILSHNEQVNIGACLSSLKWCDDVVVLDSGSTDGTIDIARSYGARLFWHPFRGFGDQRNWALDNIFFKHGWLLILDADERVTGMFHKELVDRITHADEDLVGLFVCRKFTYWGKWLRRSSAFPSWILRVIKIGNVRFRNMGHAETHVATGRLGYLKEPLIDEDFKTIDDWFDRHNRYSAAEAELEYHRGKRYEEEQAGKDPYRATSSMRSRFKAWGCTLPGRPLWYFLYAYVLRGGFLEGKKGFMYCYMKALYHAMIQIKKFDIDQRVGSERSPDGLLEEDEHSHLSGHER